VHAYFTQVLLIMNHLSVILIVHYATSQLNHRFTAQKSRMKHKSPLLTHFKVKFEQNKDAKAGSLLTTQKLFQYLFSECKTHILFNFSPTEKIKEKSENRKHLFILLNHDTI